MTEDSCPKASEENTTSATRQRKKRKWDQPAESLVSAGLAVPGVLPLGNMGALAGITLPGVVPLSSAMLSNQLPATCAAIPQVFQAPSIQQSASAIAQKINQPKIQDELIAREIVINDAESSVRYKLTKRQTQEEIQRCTGAVVITRGKYRPPNALPDGEKPLYLHISAGAHLKETAERIKAVDRAAAMVEEMLKQGPNSQPTSTFHSVLNNGGQVTQVLSACVFLGFDPDPVTNIAARIRGPNDQYINHIMNETGATVLLKGRGSGNFGSSNGEELQQPLHLFLSSNNPKSLEEAKRLAENLMDTISAEFGVSRASSPKVYNAVPPPQQLLAGVQSSGNEHRVSTAPVAGLMSSTGFSTPSIPVSSATVPAVPNAYPQVNVSQSGGFFNYGQTQPNMVSYPQPSVTGGTSYSGYGGIYPQATPLQQVALALRQTPSPVASTVASAVSTGNASSNTSSSSTADKEKKPAQKRKFQELPVASKGLAKPYQNSLQGSEFLKPGEPSEDSGVRNISTMPPPKKLVEPATNGMPPPPPRDMPPPPPRSMLPPPPPKFTSSTPPTKSNGHTTTLTKSIADPVPDTLSKLMEYGEEDDDTEGSSVESPKSNHERSTAPRPFWAAP